MSELTQCNYCSLKIIQGRAKMKEKEVTLISCDFKVDRLGGTNIYVHPKEVAIKSLSEKERKEYWVAWMLEITDHCCC